MPDSVKISELAPRTALADDVLPAVDGTLSATIRVSAASIAAIGGGPPGDNTVTTAKLANNSVTLPKIQQIAARKVLGNSTASAGNVTEIAATDFGLSMLNAANSTAGRALLNDSSSFTGQATFADGTAAAPSIANTGDLNCGIFFPDADTVGIATEGTLRFYIDAEGTQYSHIAGQPASIRPQFACRAWAAFQGTGTTGTITINNQGTIAARYGVTNSIWNDGGNTRDRMEVLENARGLTLKDTNSAWQVGSVAADGRSNYTTPGDNVHYYWDPTFAGGSWRTTAATGKNWVGTITLRSSNASASQPVLSSAGISSIINSGTGNFTVNFLTAMPDANYAVLVSSRRQTTWANGGDQVTSRTTTSVVITHVENSVNAITDYVAVAVFR